MYAEDGFILAASSIGHLQSYSLSQSEHVYSRCKQHAQLIVVQILMQTIFYECVTNLSIKIANLITFLGQGEGGEDVTKE